MYTALKWIGSEFLLPFHDYFTGLTAAVSEKKFASLSTIVIAFIAGWWMYVPIHELFHAFGCLLGGGEVTSLELSSIYGAALLHKVFPFITVGSEYAGRLADFETHDNDLIYLLTVFFPYLLTIFIGIPLLRYVGHRAKTSYQSCIWFGLSLPIAYAPFISVTGDYYEMASIIVTGLASFLLPDFRVERWRSDDFIKLMDELAFSTETTKIEDIFGIIFSLLLGVTMIFLTYRAGRFWSRHALKL
jgi:hypothetical protein